MFAASGGRGRRTRRTRRGSDRRRWASTSRASSSRVIRVAINPPGERPRDRVAPGIACSSSIGYVDPGQCAPRRRPQRRRSPPVSPMRACGNAALAAPARAVARRRRSWRPRVRWTRRRAGRRAAGASASSTSRADPASAAEAALREGHREAAARRRRGPRRSRPAATPSDQQRRPGAARGPGRPAAGAPASSPRRSASHSLPPSSSRFSPSRHDRPASGRSGRPAWRSQCSSRPTTAIVGVGIDRAARRSRCRSETLPETTGVPSARAASPRPRVASANSHMISGFSGLPKLRQLVSASGRAPVHATLRAASATAATAPA